MSWAKSRTEDMLNFKDWQSISEEESTAIMEFVRWVMEYNDRDELKLDADATARIRCLADLYLLEDRESVVRRERTERNMLKCWVEGKYNE